MCKSSRSPRILAAALLAIGLSLGTQKVVAQSTTSGAISGTVKDPQGLAVPKASVTVQNKGTDKKDQAATDDFGQFRIVDLQPGVYSVAVDASSFGSVARENVVVEVGRITQIEIPLAVMGTTQTVEVTGAASLVNTTQADVSENVNQKFINDLPINGRRWSTFALTTPGAVPDGNFGLVSFRGVSGLLNNNTVDGGDNNQAFFSEEKGRTRIGYSVCLASVQEFQVNTSNYSAEYGRAAGGVVNAVTKSGTNDLHGSAFYYIRDNKVGAANPFTVQSQLVNGVVTPVRIKPKDRRQQFGGSLGGPIQKDKLFFFFSWDQQRRNFPGVAAPGSPTFFNLTAANQSLLNARGVSNAQRDAGIAFLQGLTGPVNRRGDQYIFFPKVDWHLKQNHTLSASYNRLHWDSPAGIQTQPVVARGTASFGNDFVRTDTLIVRLNSVFSTNLTNEARFQYGRDNEFQSSQKPGPGEPTTGPGSTTPQVSIALSGGGIEVGKPDFLDRRAYPDEKRYQWADTVSMARGKHFLKFGADVNHVNDLQDSLFRESGAYSFASLVDFLSDFAKGKGCGPAANPNSVSCYSNFQQGFGPPAFRYSTNDYGFFAQDDWRFRPHLTVNAGLRYEYEQLPKPQVPNPGVPQTIAFPSDKNNWGPRVGFAWDIFGDGKTSLRGGYGVYYGRIINSTIANAITNTGSPQAQVQTFFQPTTANAPVYPNTLGGGTAGAPDVVFFSPSMQNPLIHQTDLAFERDLGWNTVLRVSYLGSYGRSLPNFIDRNLNAPTSTATYTIVGGSLDGQKITFPFYTGPRPTAAFGRMTEIISNVDSRYSALAVQVNRRLTQGLEFRTNYVWSHSTDNGQNSQTFTSANSVFDPTLPGLESGNSNFDIRHRFVASVVWTPEIAKNASPLAKRLLNGYTVAPLVILSSGVPFTPSTAGNAPVTMPNTTPGGGINGSGGTARFPLFSRNSFHFPSNKNVDLRVSRRFHITEKYRLEVLAEAFNLFNHVNVTDVSRRLYFVGGTQANRTLTLDPLFGTATASGNTLFRERQIQFAARFDF